MAEHFIPRTRASGTFRADTEPALRVVAGAGDRITVETDDAAYAELEATGDLAAVTATINPVTGPVFVEGAHPGDALAGPMGPEPFARRIPVADGQAHLAAGLSLPVAPMIGCLGVAPAQGEASTLVPARPTGGNLDLTEVRAGSTVLLPVEVEGALVSVGDLHAVMAKGEPTLIAVEVAGTATVSLDVVTGLHLRAPRVDTGTEVVCVGLGDPVQAAIAAACESLFSYLVDEHGWDRGDAYVVMSAAAHVELGGPAGSHLDPAHPLTPAGAIATARLPHDVVAALGR